MAALLRQSPAKLETDNEQKTTKSHFIERAFDPWHKKRPQENRERDNTRLSGSEVTRQICRRGHESELRARGNAP